MITAYINRHGHIITLTECGARARLVPGIGMEDDTGDVYPYGACAGAHPDERAPGIGRIGRDIS